LNGLLENKKLPINCSYPSFCAGAKLQRQEIGKKMGRKERDPE
jgi:hypothetical protein